MSADEKETMLKIMTAFGRSDLAATMTNVRAVAKNVKELCLDHEPGWKLFLEFKDLERLSLCKNNIKELPDDLDLPNLNGIKLGMNKFREFPKYLRHHNVVGKIFLNNNEIAELPDTLILPFLNELNLDRNRIDIFPTAINSLINIEVLSLHANQIRKLPADAFEDCPNLKDLYLSGNPLGKVPVCLNHCSNLKILGLHDCNLKELPDWFGEKLRGLDQLLLTCNKQLTEVPNSGRLLKQCVINGNGEWRKDFANDFQIYNECDRIEAMITEAENRHAATRRVLAAAAPTSIPILTSVEMEAGDDLGDFHNDFQKLMNQFI